MLSEEQRELAIANFVQIVKFKTISGEGPLNGAYDACGDWLLNQLIEIGFEAEILPESKPHKPVVVGKWEGSMPSEPAVLLNGHYDVVPVTESEWTVPCFEGLDKDGKIHGRGTQDMKCVLVQYLAALRSLKELGYEPVRTILVSFVPDEEIGGADGMNVLLGSAWFQGFEIGVALDEGLASEDDDYSVFYGERLPWWVSVVAKGNTGHASRFIEGTAVEQLLEVANRATAFRGEQRNLLHGVEKGVHQHAGCSHSVARKKTLGDVTSLNITVLRAAVQSAGADAINVVPDLAELKMDIRIPPHIPPAEMKATLDSWCAEVTANTRGLPANGGVSWSLVNNPLGEHHVTCMNPETNPWWLIFVSTIQSQCGIKLNPSVFPAATDSRFLRAMGIKAFGFSPIRRSAILLHEHDEHLDKDIFIEGCEIYARLIRALTISDEFEEYVDPDSYEFAEEGFEGCPFSNDGDSDDDESTARFASSDDTTVASSEADGALPPPPPAASPAASGAAPSTDAPAVKRCPYGHG